MSASSQASGTNYLERSWGGGQSAITFCVWLKANAFDKNGAGYDSPIAIENGNTGSYQSYGLQQDPNGAGTADVFTLYSYNVSGGTFVSPDLYTTGNVATWRFVLFSASGTNVTIYWGTESGGLSSQTIAAGFNATAIQRVRLAADAFADLSNTSYRGARLWLGQALDATQATAERDSATYAPAFTTGLDSYLALANGTTPNVATTGTNWTLTGTFTTDASNPALGGGGGGSSSASALFFGGL